jgi:hypothetical protein
VRLEVVQWQWLDGVAGFKEAGLNEGLSEGDVMNQSNVLDGFE